MPRIAYTASNFAGHWGPRLTGTHAIQISWPELIWAAVTMGKPGVSYLLAHGWHSASDIIVRSHTVYANLQQVASRHIEKSSLYTALDPTEKGATSYFIGMMAAKIVAARLLDTPWLFHLSMFDTLGGHAVLLGKSQPDLIGLNRARGWVVVEAKGRTNGYSASAALAAKEQTRQLRQINGVPPVLRVAVQAYFSPQLEFAIDDPEEFADDAEDIKIDLKQAVTRYYSFIESATRDTPDTRLIGKREFSFYTLGDIGVSIGIDNTTATKIRTGTPERVVEEPPDTPSLKTTDASLTQVFPDGIAISLDDRWSMARMTRDPTTRASG